MTDGLTIVGAIKPERLTRFLQKILYDNSVDFLVAPYSSWAQVSGETTRHDD